MVIKVSNNKRFYWWLKIILILVILLTSFVHAGFAGFNYVPIKQSETAKMVKIMRYITNNVDITSTPSAIYPTSVNQNSYSEIKVTVTNYTGSPLSGVTLSLTSTGGDMTDKSGNTTGDGTFNTRFFSSYSGTFLLNASDNFGGFTSVPITVLNTPPTAKFSFPESNSAPPLTVTFDASGSKDIDGTIESYSWDFGDGTAQGSGKGVTHIYQNAGEFTPSLTVTDNLGDSNTFTSTSKIVVINPVQNTNPTALFSVNLSNGVEPLTVYFDASGSNDVDGNIASYSWDFGDGGKENIGKMGTYTYQKVGEFTPSLTVTDNLGASSTFTSPSKIVVTNPIPGSLVVSISSEPVSVESNKTSTINVTVKGTDGKDIPEAKVNLFTDGGKVDPSSGKTDPSGKFISTFTALSVGKVKIKAQVTKEGSSDGSADVDVIVPPGINNTSLSVSISSDPNPVGLNNLSTINVTVKGNDGKEIPEANVTLTVNNGGMVERLSGTTNLSGQFTSNFTSSTEGNYTVRASVKKNGFNDSSNETTLQVISPPPKQEPNNDLASKILANLTYIGGALLIVLVGVVIVRSKNKKAPAPITVPVATSLDLKIEPLSIPADGIATATLTIKMKDKNGNFVSSSDKRTLKIESDIICDIKGPQEISSGQDTVTSTITSKQIGTATIKVSLNPEKGEGSLLGEGKVEFIEPAPKEAGLDIKIDRASVTADGKSTATITITVLDDKENSIASPNERTVQLSTDIGTLPMTTVTMLPGEKSVTAVISSEQIGAAKVVAKSNSLKEVTAQINFVPNEAGLDVQFKPPSIPADGKSTADVIIRIKDDKGNFIPAFEEKTVELSTTLGTITPMVKIPSQAQAGIATITSGEVKGIATVKATTKLNGEEKSLFGEGKVVFEELSKRYCMHCGKTMTMEASNCPECGRIPPSGVDTKQCSTCDAVLPQSAKFCDSCGARQPM